MPPKHVFPSPMAASSMLILRIDEDLKRKSQKTLEKLGFDLSSSIRIFLRQVVKTKSIPFRVVVGEERRKR